MSDKKADVFLTYCTNAVLAQNEVPDLKIIKIPEELSVGADYCLVINKIYAADLRKNPGNGYSLLGLAEALRLQGKTDDAEAVTKRFTRS